MDLSQFKQDDFLSALKTLFNDLNVPINYVADDPIDAQEILKVTHKDNDSFKLIDDVYFVGMVDDAAFDQNPSLSPEKIKSDYDGILIFGVTLQERENSLLPTRSQLAEISRAFNREYYYTPVVIVFKYQNYIAFANTERLKYKQEWREGEKAGKVTLLRDIDVSKPHAGHQRIINQLRLSTTGTNKVDSFATLYEFWQSVFSVSLLNKKFYEELSNWYFWAIKEVRFPSEPIAEIGQSLDTNRQEHNAKNVIRLLTRFLFVWFIKEKKLIPEELFDIAYIEESLLKTVSPYREDNFLTNQQSYYYKAVLQNLFFATLNQEMGKREFRKENRQNQNITNLLRYNSYFKNPDQFIELVEATVPFMNGGLFECLDKPHATETGRQGGAKIIYEDGFSDRTDNELIVPDYLFFGTDEEIDLSAEYGSKSKKYKQAAVKGLIKIFESYKFTIAENTPIEEDVALDPELLGKVFENLLASYNPETKTTARKQTGSFYTPREIVTYMVDESLIAYLKGAVKNWCDIEELDKKLHELLSFDPVNPFDKNDELQVQIIKALDQCTILDPACGSGAFPMGILQKMTHLLDKLDPRNEKWKQRQIDRVQEAIQAVEKIDDVSFRDNAKKELTGQIQDIEEAFNSNELDYGRKLYLIENCLYGVDIQPIAVQISKLRFFISLVVDQTVDKSKPNFAIRPLPNLETRFVAANTLIGIDKSEYSGELFANPKILELEKELQVIRHRVFSAKTPKTKRKLHDEDQVLRDKMGGLLITDGWDNTTATQLASWNPYDQNASSLFFDTEWMFGIKDGFDVVIGNPPYISHDALNGKKHLKNNYKTYEAFADIYCYFFEKGIKLLRDEGILIFITSNSYLRSDYGKPTRDFLADKGTIHQIINMPETQIFETAIVDTVITGVIRGNIKQLAIIVDTSLDSKDFTLFVSNNTYKLPQSDFKTKVWGLLPSNISLIQKVMDKNKSLETFKTKIRLGIATGNNEAFLIDGNKRNSFISQSVENKNIIKPILRGKDIARYSYKKPDKYLLLTKNTINVKSEYPDIYEYLNSFGDKFKKRGAKGKHWANLRACSFFDDFKKEKIVWIELTDKGKFSLCTEEVYLLNSAYFMMPPQELNIRYLLAILNSKAIGFYIKTIAVTSGMGTTRWINNYVKEFPIPEISLSIQSFFSVMTYLIIHAKNTEMTFQYSTFEAVMDGLVFQLYFSDHMKEKEIDINSLVSSDLDEIVQERDIEQLTDNDKEDIINQLYTRWSHPDNEVRNRIKLFAVRSPDILKPILEA